MHEKTVLKISYIGAGLGILILFYFSQTAEIGEIQLDAINENIGNVVRIQGDVVGVVQKNDSTQIIVSQRLEKRIDFSEIDRAPKKGDHVEITAIIEDINGAVRLEGKKVKIVGNVS